jgi:Amt family ammonium transporter
MPRAQVVVLALCVVAALATTIAAQATASNCSVSEYADSDGNCVAFKNTQQKASTDYSATLDSGNTAWMLTSGALVMIMTPGVAFFYAGLAGEEMASNTMMMSFVSMALVSITFFVYGYSGAFSPEVVGWLGYHNVGEVPGVYASSKIPNILFAFFQTQFATITPALLSGGIVGRMKFGSFLVFVFLWTMLVYTPLARWMWSSKITSDWIAAPLGWEAKMGSLDFAGGTVIHISSGFGALVSALMVGKRYNAAEPVKPHNIPLVMIGLTLLWFGWFGFNAGSSTAADGIAAMAAVNTHLAASAGFLMWMALDYITEQRIDPCGAASGAVAGLVCITPGCGYVLPWASVVFGVVAAIVSFYAVQFKNKLRYDDTLDAFGIHGVSGFTGGILTGLFATKKVNPAADGAFYGNWTQLLHQVISQLVSVAYTVVVTFLILLVLKYTIGIRVSEEKEIAGVDVSYHGGGAYAGTAHPNGSPTFKPANPPEGEFVSLQTPEVDHDTSAA